MRVWALVSLLALLAIVGAAGLSPSAATGAAGCGAGAHGSRDYGYAGHQATATAHGVRAVITPLVAPSVRNGHVAGWVGVGGPGAGPNGEDQWLQAGIASLPGTGSLLYAEVTRAGAEPVFHSLRSEVRPGEPHRIAVIEIAARPHWWRIWVDGKPATKPIELPGSSKRWKPIATAESWNGGTAVCNGFAFRFEQVGVAGSPGGSWTPFVPGYRFLDRGFGLRQLQPAPAGVRTLARDTVRPFAFEALG